MVHLGGHGDYTVWLDGDRTRVLVYSGEARVTDDRRRRGQQRHGGDNHRVEVDTRGQVSPVVDLPRELLANADFGQRDQGWQALDVPNSPLDVNGTRSWVTGPNDSGDGLRVVAAVGQAGARRDGAGADS